MIHKVTRPVKESCNGHRFTRVSLLAELWRCDECRSLTCYNDVCMFNHCCCGEEKVGCVQRMDHLLRENEIACTVMGG